MTYRIFIPLTGLLHASPPPPRVAYRDNYQPTEERTTGDTLYLVGSISLGSVSRMILKAHYAMYLQHSPASRWPPYRLIFSLFLIQHCCTTEKNIFNIFNFHLNSDAPVTSCTLTSSWARVGNVSLCLRKSRDYSW